MSRLLSPLLLATLALLPAGAAAGAQALRLTDLSRGDRVRLDAPRVGAERLVGDVEALTPDTLRVREERGGESVAIPVAAITRASLSLVQRSRGEVVRRALLIGGAGGAALGAAITLIDRCTNVIQADQTEEDCEPKAEQVLVGVLAGAVVGGALGALVGTMLPTERWARVELPSPLRVGVRPATGGRWAVVVAVRR